jgi:hypothetical protein
VIRAKRRLRNCDGERGYVFPRMSHRSERVSANLGAWPVTSYRMLRFLTDSSAHVSFHMSQFLGTGVVRAYQTERCGVPGLRILIHPNLEPLLDKEALRVIPVTAAGELKLNVQSEVNYLDPTNNNLGADYQDCTQFDCLRSMAGLTEEPLQYHYIETFKAWNTMRAQLGRLRRLWSKFQKCLG